MRGFYTVRTKMTLRIRVRDDVSGSSVATTVPVSCDYGSYLSQNILFLAPFSKSGNQNLLQHNPFVMLLAKSKIADGSIFTSLLFIKVIPSVILIPPSPYSLFSFSFPIITHV
jgi:hypothetical protein